MEIFQCQWQHSPSFTAENWWKTAELHYNNNFHGSCQVEWTYGPPWVLWRQSLSISRHSSSCFLQNVVAIFSWKYLGTGIPVLHRKSFISNILIGFSRQEFQYAFCIFNKDLCDTRRANCLTSSSTKIAPTYFMKYFQLTMSQRSRFTRKSFHCTLQNIYKEPHIYSYAFNWPYPPASREFF